MNLQRIIEMKLILPGKIGKLFNLKTKKTIKLKTILQEEIQI